MHDWIPIVGPLAGVVVGGLITGFIEHWRFSSERDERTLRLRGEAYSGFLAALQRAYAAYSDFAPRRAGVNFMNAPGRLRVIQQTGLHHRLYSAAEDMVDAYAQVLVWGSKSAREHALELIRVISDLAQKAETLKKISDETLEASLSSLDDARAQFLQVVHRELGVEDDSGPT